MTRKHTYILSLIITLFQNIQIRQSSNFLVLILITIKDGKGENNSQGHRRTQGQRGMRTGRHRERCRGQVIKSAGKEGVQR